MQNLLFPHITQLKDRPFETVHITSHDGIKLAGRFYASTPEAPVDICFHGWRGLSIRDFCYASNLLFNLNHNILLIEERAHGLSEGHTITFGIKERLDVVDWVNYFLNRFGSQVKINLVGVSMGAATILMAANLNLPSNVKHIIADCPYSSPIKIINKVCQLDLHLPAKLLHPFIVTGARIFGKFNIMDKNADATKTVQNCDIPILIIHGENDKFVPCQMSQEIAMSNQKIKRETFPNADHGLSLLEDSKRYTKIVTDFLSN